MKLQVKANQEASEKLVVVMSAEKNVNLDFINVTNNVKRTAELEGMLKEMGVPYKRATGIYKGEREVSFVGLPADEADLNGLVMLGINYFEQESVLVRDAEGVHLIFADFGKEKIGNRFKSVPQCVALAEDCSTYIDGQYFIVR